MIIYYFGHQILLLWHHYCKWKIIVYKYDINFHTIQKENKYIKLQKSATIPWGTLLLLPCILQLLFWNIDSQ